MHIALSLVGLTFLATQCHSRAVRVNDRQYPIETLLYHQPIDQRNLKQERPLQQQQVSRASEQYVYRYDPERSYPQESQFEPIYSRQATNQIKSRPKQGKPLPVIEQYLKEVTPTTKTAYDPKNYKSATEIKAVQYNHRQETQQQPSYAQQYIEESPKGAPVAQNILAYHNALLAHQNAVYEQQRIEQLKREQQRQREQQQQHQQDAVPHSAIYLTQSIQKERQVKPKTSTLDDEIDYYTKLQYEQQLKQQNQAYEVKEAPPVKYQARIPQNSKPELLTTEEENAFLYQPEPQYNQPRGIVKPAEEPREQIYLSDVKYQQKVVYQPVAPNEDVKYYEQPQVIQYQLQPVPEYEVDQKQVRYQEPVRKEIQAESSRADKYRGNIVKYHALQSNKVAKVRQQVTPQYVLDEQTQRPQRYQSQQYAEPEQVQQQPQNQQRPAYLGPTDEEYRQSQFKQSLGRNSSLRVLKTGKPVVFIGHEE